MVDADEHDNKPAGAEENEGEAPGDDSPGAADGAEGDDTSSVTGLVSPALANRLTVLAEGLLTKAPMDEIRASGERMIAEANAAVTASIAKPQQWGGAGALVSNAKHGEALRRAAGSSLMQPATRSVLVELLGSSAAERAAFSITTGLKFSDSLTAKMTASAASIWPGLTGTASLTNLGLTARSSAAVALAESVMTGPGIGGARPALARSLASQQLAATSGIADLIGKNSMAASWRQSLLAEATARSLAETLSLPDGGLLMLRDLVGVNATTARVVGQYADLNKAKMLGPAASVRPTRELRSFLTGLPEAPDLDDLTFAGQASRGIAGITAADILSTGGTVGEDAGSLLQLEIVDPWVSGPQRVQQGLYARLELLDPTIRELLQAAWDQVERNGPAAVSMTAHAVVEALDRTLRGLAPDDAVLAAHSEGRLTREAVYEKGNRLAATRRGRVLFVCLGGDGKTRKLIGAQAEALAEAIPALQGQTEGSKHASQGTIDLLFTRLVAAESLLLQLLHEHDN